MQKCPQDLSCVVTNIRHSPRIPGNIAVIVQLLHNISTALLTNVNEAKMQVSTLECLGGQFWGEECRLVGVFCELLGACVFYLRWAAWVGGGESAGHEPDTTFAPVRWYMPSPQDWVVK